MPQKNPYETQESNEIPDFISNSQEQFSNKQEAMPEEKNPGLLKRFLTKEVEVEVDEPDEIERPVEEKRPVKKEKPVEKKPKKGGNAWVVFLLVLFVIAAVEGFLLLKIRNNYQELDEKYQTLEKEAEDKYAAYEKQISKLEEELEDEPEVVEQSSSEQKYKVILGMNVRVGAGSSNSLVTLSSLPLEIQYLCVDNSAEGFLYLVPDSIVTVYETKGDGLGGTWGRIADNAWICLNDGETVFAQVEK